MLRYSLPLSVLLLTAGRANASWADSLFDELSRDFGSVARGQIVTHPFRVANTTKNTVHISHVRVSCGCTSAQALQTTLAPGQETAILVQMDTRRFYSTKNVTVYVQFDQPRFEEVRLWVQANSRDDVSIQPDALAFGRIKRGSSPSAQVTISFFGGQYEVTEVQCESNYVTPVCKLVRREGGEVSYQLAANLRPDAPAGKWFTDLWLKTNSPTMPKVRVPLTVEIESLLSVMPSAVTLGKVRVGSDIDRKVVIRGVQPFRITNIAGNDAQVQVKETNAQSKTVHVLTLTLRPNRAGEINRTTRVKTDLKTAGEIEFTAQADVVP